MLTYDESESCNFQYIALEIDEDSAGLSRDQLAEILHAENVIARRYFYPGCHQMEPYRSYFPHAGLLVPNTEYLVKRILLLPTGSAIGPAEISEICALIRLAAENAAEVRSRLAELCHAA